MHVHAHTDQLQVHLNEGAQHGIMTGSGAYREYPKGMVNLPPTSGEIVSYAYFAVGTSEGTTIRSTEETTGKLRWCS